AIQAAIAKAAGAGGGVVTLCPGTYDITAPITLATPSVTLRGTGEATVLHSKLKEPVLAIAASDVAVQQLRISTTGVGISFGGLSTNCRITDVTVDSDTVAIGLSGWQLGTVIRDSRLSAATGIGSGPKDFLSFGLTIEGNLITAGRRGIDLSGSAVLAGSTRVAGNTIQGSAEAGVDLTGVTVTDALLALLKTPGAVPPAALTVCDNVLRLEGGDGIRVGPGAIVSGNVVSGSPKQRTGTGIAVIETKLAGLAGDVTLTGNRVTGVALGIGAMSTWDSLRVQSNTLNGL